MNLFRSWPTKPYPIEPGQSIFQPKIFINFAHFRFRDKFKIQLNSISGFEMLPKTSRNFISRTSRQNVGWIIIIIISLFQEDNIFGTNASLTYGPRLQR